MSGVSLVDTVTGEESEYETDGVFVYIGANPSNHSFFHMPIKDDAGYVRADEEMQTDIPGVFAAGDIRTKTLRQVVTAAADGSIAAQAAQKYLENLK